ncbi:MAG: hypothetical protein Q9190_007779 [Brigantiaea leucoxantha]
MARIQIPLDALTSRLNLGSRFEGVRSQSLSTRFANLKPLSEFLDLKRLSKPANFGEAQGRVNYNLAYFSSNYVAVAIMLSIYSLLTNLTLLFDIVFVCLGLFGIRKLDGRDLELGFTRATTSQLYTGLFVIAVPLFIWANPISSALWLVGATGPKRKNKQERRFEEIDSDEDDGQGVVLDDSLASDALHFTGADLTPRDYYRFQSQHSHSSDSSESESELPGDGSGRNLQLALRDKEDVLVQKALERIRRAQMLGRPNVELTQREYDALERKSRQDRANQEDTSGAHSNDRRRISGYGAKESKAGRKRRGASDPALETASSSARPSSTAPGILVPEADGLSHTPFGYYQTIVQPDPRSASSSGSRRGTPPVPSSGQHRSQTSRHSSGSDYPLPYPAARSPPLPRRLPDDPNWIPRPRSASNQPHSMVSAQHQPRSPPLPQSSSQSGSARRIVSGPAQVQYPGMRKPVPMPSSHAASSEPALTQQTYYREPLYEDNGSNDDTDDEDDGENRGVQVNVVPQGHGYEIYTRSGDSGRQRRNQR